MRHRRLDLCSESASKSREKIVRGKPSGRPSRGIVDEQTARNAARIAAHAVALDESSKEPQRCVPMPLPCPSAKERAKTAAALWWMQSSRAGC